MRFRKAAAAALIIGLGISLILVYVQAAYTEEEAPPITMTTPLRGDTMEANSNRQVHPFSTGESESQFGLEGFEKAAESAETELWLNKEWNTIRLKNKRTGYVWGALPVQDAEGLNKTWNSYGNSIAAIECFDKSGVEKRYGMTGNAATSYTMDSNGFTCHAEYGELGVSFDVTVALEGNRLQLSVDEASIAEGEEFKLKSMTFLPYFGSGYSDQTDGYLFVPDGSGALIRFQKPANYSSAFSKKVYGKDLAIDVLADPSDLKAYRPNDYIVEDPQVLMPVYGVVHGAYQNGVFGVIDQGAEYASIVANPAAPNNPYNWAAARFEFRQKYNLSTNRKEGTGAIVPQEHRNELSPSLSLYVLDGEQANYDGMAVFYRGLLEKSGTLLGVVGTDSSLPLRLEILGAGLRDEFLGKSVRVFTKAEEAQGMVRRLTADGITNLSLVYRGYTKNDEAGNPLLKKLGGKQDFAELAELVSSQGGRYYWYLDPMSANTDQINQRSEAANNLSNMVIRIGRENFALLYRDTYFYRLSEMTRRVEKALNRGYYADAPVFAVNQLSFRLYGDYTRNQEKTRAENLPQFISLVEKLAGGQSIPLYQPNQYLWKYTSEFYNVPLTSSQYLFETDTVPFLQIVLSGHMELFGAPLNTGTYSSERLLRMIEYGISPSFTVTDCPSEDLYKTTQEDFFSTNFDDWEGFITESYSTVQDALQPVRGQAMVSHRALSAGFILTVYDNGTKVYVNYTNETKTDGGVTVEPYGYQVVAG